MAQQPPLAMAMPPGFSMPFQSFQMTPAMMKAARYPKQPKRAPPEEPNTTLYVHNLHDKKSKKMLKQELVYLFSKYGQVLDISVKKRLKMRGQAFVVFRELSSAEAAIKELQGSVLFNRPMDIQYARHKSDVTAKLDGTLEENQKERAERKANAPPSDEESEEDDEEKSEAEAEEDGDEGERPAKKAKEDNKPVAAALAATAFPASFPGFQPNAFGYAPEEPPNSILFVQGVPQETTEDTLKALFQQYQGFKEVRLVRRNNVAFVEYETEGQAIIAKMALHGYKTTEDGQMIAVTYAKK